MLNDSILEARVNNSIFYFKKQEGKFPPPAFYINYCSSIWYIGFISTGKLFSFSLKMFIDGEFTA